MDVLMYVPMMSRQYQTYFLHTLFNFHKLKKFFLKVHTFNVATAEPTLNPVELSFHLLPLGKYAALCLSLAARSFWSGGKGRDYLLSDAP